MLMSSEIGTDLTSKTGMGKEVLWSPSYFAGSVAVSPSSILKEYIEQQKPRFNF